MGELLTLAALSRIPAARAAKGSSVAYSKTPILTGNVLRSTIKMPIVFALDAALLSSGQGSDISKIGKDAVEGFLIGKVFQGSSALGRLVKQASLGKQLATPAQQAIYNSLSSAEKDIVMSMASSAAKGGNLEAKRAVWTSQLAGEATTVASIAAGTGAVKILSDKEEEAPDAIATGILLHLAFAHKGKLIDGLKGVSGRVARVWKNGKFWDYWADTNGNVRRAKKPFNDAAVDMETSADGSMKLLPTGLKNVPDGRPIEPKRPSEPPKPINVYQDQTGVYRPANTFPQALLKASPQGNPLTNPGPSGNNPPLPTSGLEAQRIETVDPKAVERASTDKRTRKIADVLRDRDFTTVDEITKLTRIARPNVEDAVISLIRAGRVETTKDGDGFRLIDRGGNAVDNNLFERAKSYGQTPVVPSGSPKPTSEQAVTGATQTTFTPEQQQTSAQVTPEQQRREAGRFTQDGVEYVRQEPLDTQALGKESEQTFATAEPPVKYRWAIIDDTVLQPAHVNGVPNRQNFIPDSQPNKRTDDVSTMSASDIASKFDPARDLDSSNPYFGPSTVNTRLETIQGNKRADAAKQRPQAIVDQNKAWYLENADRFGISTEHIASLSRPVAVRVVDVSDDDAIRLGQYQASDLESGGRTSFADPTRIAGIVPHENKAQIMSDVFLNLPEDSTLTDAIRENAPVVARHLKGHLPPDVYQTLFGKGTLTPKGVENIKEIVTHFLFTGGGSELPSTFESDAVPDAVRKGIQASLHKIFGVPEKDSLVPEIQNSILGLASYQQTGMGDFETWANQPNMFTHGKTPREIFTPTEIALTKRLAQKTVADPDAPDRKKIVAPIQKDVKQLFTEYARLVNGTSTLFETAEPISKAEAVKAILGVEHQERQYDRPETDDRGDAEKGVRPTNQKTRTEAEAVAAEPSTEQPKPAEPQTQVAERDGEELAPPKPVLHGEPTPLDAAMRTRILYAKERGMTASDIAQRYNVTPEQVAAVGELTQVGEFGQMSHRLIQASTPAKQATDTEIAEKTEFVNDLAAELNLPIRLERGQSPTEDYENASDTIRKTIAEEMGKERASHLSKDDWFKWLDGHANRLNIDTVETMLDALGYQIEHTNKLNSFFADKSLAARVDKINRTLGLENLRSFKDIPNRDERNAILTLAKQYGIRTHAAITAFNNQIPRFVEERNVERRTPTSGETVSEARPQEPETTGVAERPRNETELARRDLGPDDIQFNFRPEYQGEHGSPGADDAPLHDVTKGGEVYPDDFYGPNGLRNYGTGQAVADRESYSVIVSVRNRPNARVKIYRAVPEGIAPSVQSGDWVTLSRTYAREHGESALNGKYTLVSKTVPAKHLFTNGDSLNEFGYWEDGDPNEPSIVKNGFEQRDLWGNKTTPKTEQQSFAFDAPEAVPTTQSIVDQDAAKYVKDLTNSENPKVAKMAKAIQKYARNEDVLSDAADALDIYARAISTNTPMDVMLRQLWLDKKGIVISSRATRLATAMANGNIAKVLHDESTPSLQFAWQDNPPAFYSQVERVIEQKMPNRASAEQIKGILSPVNGIKAEELNWLDIDSFLKDNPRPTKQEVLDFVRANNLQVEEVMKGDKPVKDTLTYTGSPKNMLVARREDGAVAAKIGWTDNGYQVYHPNGTQLETRLYDDLDDAKDWIERNSIPLNVGSKYSSYTLPGGENYREILLTMPMRQKSWDDAISQAKQDNDIEVAQLLKRAKFMSASKGRDLTLSNNTGNILNGARQAMSSEKDEGDTQGNFTFEALDRAKKYINIYDEFKNNFRSNHWDEPNVIGHGRVDDRDNGKTLHVAEIQPDITQEIRKLTKKVNDGTATESDKEMLAFLKTITPYHTVASASMAIFKRILRYAVENGYERVTWDTGQTQIDRYDLSKHLDSIEVTPDGKFKDIVLVPQSGGDIAFSVREDGTVYDVSGTKQQGGAWEGKPLSEVIGKDMAEKIMAVTKADTFTGDDLKTDAPGMRRFYDKIMRDEVNRYVKKWGAKVEAGSVNREHRTGQSGIITSQRHSELEEMAGDRLTAREAARLDDLIDDRDTADIPETEWLEMLNQAIGAGRNDLANTVSVHSLPITTAMEASVVQQGQTLFNKHEEAKLAKAIERAAQLSNSDLATRAKVVFSRGDIAAQNIEGLGVITNTIRALHPSYADAQFTGAVMDANAAQDFVKRLRAMEQDAAKKGDMAASRALESWAKGAEKAIDPEDGSLIVRLDMPDEFPDITTNTRIEEYAQRADNRVEKQYPGTIDNKSEYTWFGDYHAARQSLASRYSEQEMHREILGKMWRQDAADELGISKDSVARLNDMRMAELIRAGMSGDEFRDRYGKISPKLRIVANTYASIFRQTSGFRQRVQGRQPGERSDSGPATEREQGLGRERVDQDPRRSESGEPGPDGGDVQLRRLSRKGESIPLERREQRDIATDASADRLSRTVHEVFFPDQPQGETALARHEPTDILFARTGDIPGIEEIEAETRTGLEKVRSYIY